MTFTPASSVRALLALGLAAALSLAAGTASASAPAPATATATATAAPSIAAAPAAVGADGYLDPDAAFRPAVAPAGAGAVRVRIDVAQGYHLYRDRLHVAAAPAAALPVPVTLPAGRAEHDDAAGGTVQVYRDQVAFDVPLAAHDPVTLTLRYQGCADRGLCYAPMARDYVLRPGAAGWQVDAAPGGAGGDTPAAGAEPAATDSTTATAAATATNATVPPVAAVSVAAAPADTADAAPPGDDTTRFAGTLRSGSLWRVAGVFLLAGLLLSLTPCVLPMVPILSSIIVGQGGTVSRRRGLSLATAYALGMALVYTAVGVAAGLVGRGLAAAMQNPWVLGAFALLLVVFALSMFGVYSLQVPAAMQGRLSAWSGRLQGGRHAGVFAMGGLSALIVGPCVAAPLAGALVYISQTRDAVLGGVALFSLAAGMSVPLLLVGLSAGALLPRAGAWMERVKHLFGFMLIGVALWMVWPVLPGPALMVLAAVALMSSAAYLGLFAPRSADGTRAAAGRAAGTMLAAMALMELAGAAAGGHEPLRPLRGLVAGVALPSGTGVPGDAAAASPGADGPGFRHVASLPALEAAVRASDRPVMVDVSADWCVSCRELDERTFGDPTVRQGLSRLTLLRVDVTQGSPAQQAVMRRFGLFGPPAVLFFPGRDAGHEVARVIGFQPPDRFLETLRHVEAP